MARPAAELRERVLAEHPEAVVARRGRNLLLHRLSDDRPHGGRARYVLDASIGPLHYGPDADQEIETDIRGDVARSGFVGGVERAGFESQFNVELSAPWIAEYRKEGRALRFKPVLLRSGAKRVEPRPVTGTVTDDTIRWDDAFGQGIHLEWQVQTGRLAKRLILDEPLPLEGDLTLVLRVGLVNLTLPVLPKLPDVADIPNMAPVAFDGGFLRWPRSWDAEGDTVAGDLSKTTQAGELFIMHRVPQEWLEQAAYPVTIDVDVDEQVGAGADDGWHRAVTHVWNNTTTNLNFGSFSGAFYGYGAFQRFTTVAVPQGATIDAAYLTFTAAIADSDATCQAKVEAHDTDDATAPANHTSYDNIAWTTASVVWNPIPAFTIDVEYNTPSIVSVVQELIDRPGWVSGNAMLYRCSDYSQLSDAGALRSPHSYEGSTTKAPKLHVEYTEGFIFGAAILSGVGSLTGVGGATRPGAAALAGVGSLTVVGTTGVTQLGQAALAGVGSLTAAGQRTATGVAELAGVGSLTAVGARIRTGAAALPGVGALTAIGEVSGTLEGRAALSGVGTLTADAEIVRNAAAVLAGAGTLSAVGRATFAATAALAGVGTLAAIGQTGVPVFAAVGRVERVFDPNDFPANTDFFFEALVWSDDGNPVTARLFNKTTGSEVTGSELTTSDVDPVRLRSGVLTLPSGLNVYRVEATGNWFVDGPTIIWDSD